MTRHLMFLAAWAALVAVGPQVSAALLAVDVDARAGEPTPPSPAGPNTVAGFESFTIDTPTGGVATATRTLASGYTVTFNVFDDNNANDGGPAGDSPGLFDDRDRVSPSGTPADPQPNAGAPTLNQLYDDFLFVGASAGPIGGIDLLISGGALTPNRQYRVSIYAYDGINASGGSGTPVRTANYFDGNNLDSLALTTVFATNVRPTADDTYKFTGVAMTDATGKLFLKGRRVTAADVAVYINGFEVSAVPEPASAALAGVCLPIAALATRRRRK
jgi:hypothetical protein